MLISSTLKNWYLQKKRNLPWRNTQNPYHIWISEVIMQQTRVAQGTDYFIRFIDRFPDILQLAEADNEDILKLWQGLGYYSRARNLHEGARFVVKQHKGQLPPDYEKLLEIKGIGMYTAAAIASIAFNLPYPVVDGNVNRVISRLFGVYDPINSTEGIKKIKIWVDFIFDNENPGMHNQAIMEFGALQCTIHNPDCQQCPLQLHCHAFLHEKVHVLPFKIAASKPRNRYFNYIVIRSDHFTFIKKRNERDIWRGLYEFPLIETMHLAQSDDLIRSAEWVNMFGAPSSGLKPQMIIPGKGHKLSHQTIHAVYYIISINSTPELSDDFIKIPWAEIDHYPVSRMIENFINEHSHRLSF